MSYNTASDFDNFTIDRENNIHEKLDNNEGTVNSIDYEILDKEIGDDCNISNPWIVFISSANRKMLTLKISALLQIMSLIFYS